MICIAIDGPSGSGKSTVAKALAKKLNFLFLDTGALYRTVAYYFKTKNVNFNSNSEVEEALNNISIKILSSDQGQRILLRGKDITSEIRSEEISLMSSKVAAIFKVREYLLETQRAIAGKNNVIMEGRDIGTAVMPDAEVKIFLTASPELRAKRRHLQLNDESIQPEKVLKDLIERDNKDLARKICPLKIAEDAILFDSSKLTLEETIDNLLKIIKERIKFLNE